MSHRWPDPSADRHRSLGISHLLRSNAGPTAVAIPLRKIAV
jgi:hypothetical protein